MAHSILHCYPKTKTNMFVVARQITRRFSVFGCSPRLKLGQLWRIFLDVVVPAWSAGTQVNMEVSGCIPADLDAGSPCRHDGCDAVIVS